MKIGVFTVLFAQRPFAEALDYIRAAGVEAVEIGTGGAPGNAHCNLDELVDNPTAQKAWMNEITSRGLEISALSCHGNPLHPNKELAGKDDATYRKTVKLAEQIGVKTVITSNGSGRKSRLLTGPKRQNSRKITACELPSNCIQVSLATTPNRFGDCARSVVMPSV
jgi:sugar phosphate isomerase/epimerase